MAHERFPGFYVSEDSRFGGIWIRTDLGAPDDVGIDEAGGFADVELDAECGAPLADDPVDGPSDQTDMMAYPRFARALAEVLDDPVVLDALTLHPVGNPVLQGFFNAILVAEMTIILLGSMAIMMFVLGVLFRSLSGEAWPLAIIVFSMAVSFGLAGRLGLTMSPMVSVLSLLIVPIPPVRNVAMASALGIMVAFGFTAIVLPLLLDLWAPAPRTRGGASSSC